MIGAGNTTIGQLPFGEFRPAMDTEIAPDLDLIVDLPDDKIFAQQTCRQDWCLLQLIDTDDRMPIIPENRIV